MQLGTSESQFLWHLFYLHFLKKDVEGAYAWISSIYDRALDLPANLEALLLKYWSGRDESKLFEAALICARQSCFTLERQVLLIALSVEKGGMDIDEASQLLWSMRGLTDDMSAPVRKLFDVVWLVHEDQKDSVMGVQQDDLLKNALRSVLRQEHEA